MLDQQNTVTKVTKAAFEKVFEQVTWELASLAQYTCQMARSGPLPRAVRGEYSCKAFSGAVGFLVRTESSVRGES